MFIVQQKREEISAVGKDNRREEEKKKGKRRYRRCQCGGNLLHWGLFKSCISSIFPFSFCPDWISLFRSKRPVYFGMAGIVRYRLVSWAVHFEGVSVPVHWPEWRIPVGTVWYLLPWLRDVSYTTVHLWHNSYSINISNCGVWGARPEVQVSSAKFHTHIYLN